MHSQNQKRTPDISKAKPGIILNPHYRHTLGNNLHHIRSKTLW
uniref:Uncharacterized protein n=1 Tax=Rhizophora mucronata TaxID=61149 RepID=A0A2P2NRS4_RHIMU